MQHKAWVLPPPPPPGGWGIPQLLLPAAAASATPSVKRVVMASSLAAVMGGWGLPGGWGGQAQALSLVHATTRWQGSGQQTGGGVLCQRRSSTGYWRPMPAVRETLATMHPQQTGLGAASRAALLHQPELTAHPCRPPPLQLMRTSVGEATGSARTTGLLSQMRTREWRPTTTTRHTQRPGMLHQLDGGGVVACHSCGCMRPPAVASP
jgi:hypothetical protein